MGVYIKGMEVPKRCDARCPFYGFKSIYDCSITKKAYNWGLTTRPSDCPLIPVPDHGSLIEAERLKEVFHRNVVCGDAFDQLIDIAPTIIPSDKEA